MDLKPYQAYDRLAGPGEAAMLVFANNAREAKKISYGVEWCNSDWIDWTATRIWDLPDHLKVLVGNSPCVVTAPDVCENCGTWGGHPRDGGCSHCQEDGS